MITAFDTLCCFDPKEVLAKWSRTVFLMELNHSLSANRFDEKLLVCILDDKFSLKKLRFSIL